MTTNTNRNIFIQTLANSDQFVPSPENPAQLPRAISDLANVSNDASIRFSSTPLHINDFENSLVVARTGTIEPAENSLSDHMSYAKSEGTWERAGVEDEWAINAIVSNLVGLKAGDKQTVEQTFASDFRVEPLQNQTVTYNFEVIEVRRKVPPELDAAFFEKQQVSSLEEWEQSIRTKIEERKKQEDSQFKQQQITQHLIENTEFAIAESALDMERENLLKNHLSYLSNQGVKQEEFEANKDILYQKSTEEAVFRIKRRLILSAVAEKEKIKLEQNEILNILHQYSMQYRMKIDDVVNLFKDNKEFQDTVHSEAICSKTLILLEEKANETGKAVENQQDN